MIHTIRHVLIAAFLTAACASMATADTFEPNDTPQQASELPNGVPTESFISVFDDVDFFFVDADVGDLVITLTGIPSGADYDLWVTDESGEPVCFDPEDCKSENSENQNELLSLDVSSAGRFWVVVFPFDGFSDLDGYVLTAGYTPLNQNTPPTVSLGAPNGGETWTVGTTQNITWTASDTEDGTTLSVDLELSTNSGGSWSPIANGLGNSGSFAWTVTNVPTSQARIRVTATDSQSAAVQDASDADFTIETGVTPQIALSIPVDFDAGPGETVDVPVHLSTNVPLGGLQFAVAFDTQQANVVSVTDGGLLAGLDLENNTTAGGEVRIVYYSGAGASATPVEGTLCTIRFQLGGIITGDAVLTFLDAEASDPSGNALSVTGSGATLTPVRLLALDLVDAPEGARLIWSAEIDASHAGYRVRREDVGPLHQGLLTTDATEYLDRTAMPGRTYRYWLDAVARDGSVESFGPVETNLQARVWVSPAFPNPTRAGAALEIRAGDGETDVTVLDIQGRVVRRLGRPATGSVHWDGRTESGGIAPSGLYFFRIHTGSTVQTRRLVKVGD